MLPHEAVSRALLKAKAKRVPEFFGLTQTEFSELTLIAHHCQKQLGLSVSDFLPLGSRAGIRLSLSGNRQAYSIVCSPSSVYLESGPIGAQPRQIFRQRNFNHSIAGQLFRVIETQEKQCLT